MLAVQSEREIYGRTHSDDESEEAHGQNDRTVSDGCYNLGHVQTSIKGKRWKVRKCMQQVSFRFYFLTIDILMVLGNAQFC